MLSCNGVGIAFGEILLVFTCIDMIWSDKACCGMAIPVGLFLDFTLNEPFECHASAPRPTTRCSGSHLRNLIPRIS